jgi:3-hydroxyacyl-CoA dehydrogenase/enoyl-CoA hydratase/3-hydroxybutyryl-CoA epimerase
METRESLRKFLLYLNKRPFCQDESNPFILNRLLLDLQAEAFNIISENEISVGGLDALVKQYLFPIGVFEFFDHVGIDIMLSSIESYIRYSSDRELYLPMIQKLDVMVGHNQLGIKTGEGFYSYKGSVLAPDLSMQNISISEHLRKKTVSRLRSYFEKSVSTVLESGDCSRAELAVHLQDYLGIDRDPFTFFPQL